MKKITAFGITTLSYLALVKQAIAVAPPGGINIDTKPQGGFGKLYNVNFTGNLVSDILTLAFIAAAILALAFLIFGGIKWITSGGDKGGVESARNMIVAALIGLVITFLAYFLIRIIFALFGLDFGNFVLPTIG